MAKNSAADSVNMFEDLMTGLQDILKRLEMPGGFDDSGSEKNLVAKNIVPSETSTFNKFPAVKSILNSDEKTRAYNIGLQWARAFFDVQKMNKASEDTSKPSTVLAKAKETVGIGKGDTEKTPEKKSSILGIAAGVLGVLAAAYAVWEMFGGEGGFVMKAVSKLPNFLKLLKGTAGKIGASIFKRIKFIPFIGALAGFVFAFQRFQEGDWVKGTLELVSAIASLTVVGLPLSYIIDGALLLHDLAEERGDETGMMGAAVKGGKYGVKALVSILKKTATTVGLKLLNVLKYVPFIGGVAGLVLSYMRFQEGEWIAGIFEFVSAILDFIPGVGNIASYILDGGLLLYDLLKTPTAEGDNKPKQGSGLGFSFSNGMNYIKKLVGPALTKALPYIPVIGNFAAIYTGITSIMSGNIGFGVRKLIQGLFIFLPPGLSDQLINGFEWLMSMFTDGEQESDGLPVQAPKPFLSMVKDYIKSKLQKLPAILRKPLEWLGILDDSSGSSDSNASGVVKNETKSAEESTSSALVKAATDISQVSAATTKSVADATTSIVNTAVQTIKAATKPIIDSATNGIKSTTSTVGGTASSMIQSVTSRVKSALAPSERNNLDNIKNTSNTLKDQMHELRLQSSILHEILVISRQQLEVAKKRSDVVVMSSPNSQSNTTNISNESYNTGTQSSRQLYSSSPYTLSNA